MDTGKLVNNTAFYEGFEDEPEVELFIAKNPEFNIHIWVGYISDIYDSEVIDKSKGFYVVSLKIRKYTLTNNL